MKNLVFVALLISTSCSMIKNKLSGPKKINCKKESKKAVGNIRKQNTVILIAKKITERSPYTYPSNQNNNKLRYPDFYINSKVPENCKKQYGKVLTQIPYIKGLEFLKEGEKLQVLFENVEVSKTSRGKSIVSLLGVKLTNNSEQTLSRYNSNETQKLQSEEKKTKGAKHKLAIRNRTKAPKEFRHCEGVKSKLKAHMQKIEEIKVEAVHYAGSKRKMKSIQSKADSLNDKILETSARFKKRNCERFYY